MSTGIITIICAVIGSSALAEIIRSLVGAIQRKRGKATTQDTHFAEIDKLKKPKEPSNARTDDKTEKSNLDD